MRLLSEGKTTRTMLKPFNKIPDGWMDFVTNYFKMFPNDTVDFNRPLLNKSFEGLVPFIVCMYCILIIFGCLANALMINQIVRSPMKSDAVCSFLLNVAASNLIMDLIVLPCTLTILLIKNWILGRFLCYFLPMLQVCDNDFNR